MVVAAQKGGFLVYDGMYDPGCKMEIFPAADVELLILSEEEIRTGNAELRKLAGKEPERYPYMQGS